MSWIIRERETKKVVYETFNYDLVSILNTKKYEAVPIMDYLIELNNSVKLA